MAYNRTQQKRIDEGLCIACGNNPHRYRVLVCAPCAVLRAEKQTQRRKVRQANRQCVSCGSAAVNSRTKCAVCLERDKSYQATREAKNIAKGSCSTCGKNPPLPTFAQNSRYRLCESCYLKKTSTLRLGSGRHWKFIRDKLEQQQQHKCAYTGTTLVLGENDSLDHIYPTHHFPEKRTDPENVEWVTREINEMKRDRAPDEFLTLLKLILKTRGQGPGRGLQDETQRVAAYVS